MNAYLTRLVVPVNFIHHSYPIGTVVTVRSNLVYDGVFYCEFPHGECTYVSACRVENPPARAA